MNPITKILTELEGDPYNQERFNKINKIHVELQDDGALVFLANGWQFFDEIEPIAQEIIIRTALSKVDGQCVIECFEGEYSREPTLSNSLSFMIDVLYRSFDLPLRNGVSLDDAISSLGHTMRKIHLL